MSLIAPQPEPDPPKSPDAESPDASDRKWAKAIHSVLGCLAVQLAVLAAFIEAAQYDFLPIVGMAVAVGTGCVAGFALETPWPWHWGHARRWVGIMLVAWGLMGYSASQVDEFPGIKNEVSVNEEDEADEDEPDVTGTQPAVATTPPAGVTFGERVPAGEAPVSMTRRDDIILVLDETGVLVFDFTLKRRARLPTENPNSPFSDSPYDIAAYGTTMAVVTGGLVSLFGLPKGERLGGSVQFSQSEGHVAVTEGRVWMRDYGASKVDRLDVANYGNPVAVSVPGRPTELLAANDFLYVPNNKRHTGYLSVIDPHSDATEAMRSIVVEKGPTTCVYAFGEIWTYHPETSHITRIDATPGRERVVAKNIEIDEGIVAMAFAGGSVFTVSSTHKRLQRRDQEGDLIGEQQLPFRPTDLIAADGRLYVLSKAAEELMVIEVGPVDPLHHHGPFVR